MMKLPRIQLHLSTCILLMFVAGGLGWANVKAKPGYTADKEVLVCVERGWPTRVHVEWEIFYPHEDHWNWTHIAINLATALAILAAIAFACEWIIRRRASKNQEPTAKSQEP